MVSESVPAVPSGVPFPRRSWWIWSEAAAGIWIALLHSSLWWFDRWPAPRALWGDERTYLGSALELLAAEPSWWPESLWPPLYPHFLAGLVWLGGGSRGFVVAVQLALLALVAVLLFDLVARWTGSRAAAMAAAACVLGYPPLAAFAHYLWPEVLHLFLFVALLWMLATRADRLVWCALAGVVLGLALLAKSLLLPFVPILLVAAFWNGRSARLLGSAALVLVFASMTVAPTVAASYRRTGRPAIAGSATFNLWVGLNDSGRESFRRDIVWPEFQRWVASAGSHAERDRILRAKIRVLVREKGPAALLRDQMAKQYFRLFDAGCYLTDQLPGGAAQLRSGAGYLEMDPRTGRVVGSLTRISIVLLLAAAPAGLILGGCRRHRWVRTMVLFLTYNLLLFFWLHVKTRYRIQMLPAAFAGVGCLVAWLEGGCHPRPSGVRAAAVVVVVGLLIWFAVG